MTVHEEAGAGVRKPLWRRVGGPLVRIAAGFVWLIAAAIVAQLVAEQFPARKTLPGMMASMVFMVFVMVSAYAVFVRYVEKRALSELATPGAIKELACGVCIGAGLFTVTIGVLWGLGFFQITGVNDWRTAAPALVLAVLSGVVEEMLFRGILFRITEERLGTWLALGISGLLFGLIHMMNPNATLAATLAIALEAGVLLAAAYVLTRRLWLAIGMHFAWNFTQGGVFGVAVSGAKVEGLFQSQLSGPALLSGGEFGAEASVVAVIVCTAAGGFTLWLAYRRGRFLQPVWKRCVARNPPVAVINDLEFPEETSGKKTI